MAYIFWGFNFLSMGISGFTSQSLGDKNYARLLITFKRYTLVAIVLILMTLSGARLFIEAGLWVISTSDAVADEARTYLTIRMFGVPAIVFNILLIGFFIGLQNTRISLYSLSVTQILNIGFNLFFVYGLGMQTAGIALGTVISEYLGLLLVLWHLSRTLPGLSAKVKTPVQWTWRWREFKPIFHVSSHLFIRTFVLLSAFVFFNRSAAGYGETALAVNGVLLAFFTLISHFLDGTAAAAEAQTGHSIGEGNAKTLRTVWQASGVMTAFFMMALALFFAAAGPAFLSLLTSQPDVLGTAEEQLIWVVMLPITGGIAFWLDGVFVGARRSKDMRNSVLLAFLGFVILVQTLAQSYSTLWLFFNLFFAVRSLWLLRIFVTKLWPASR
jgi:MATE family multidrug resistance protein